MSALSAVSSPSLGRILWASLMLFSFHYITMSLPSFMEDPWKITTSATDVTYVQPTSTTSSNNDNQELVEQVKQLQHQVEELNSKYDKLSLLALSEVSSTTAALEATTTTPSVPSANEMTKTNAANVPTAALCHKALFGTVQLDKVLNWAQYHHDLGFDHIYIWYQPSVSNYTGFQDLDNLPFVSMMPTAEGEEVTMGKGGYVRLYGEGAVQRDIEKICLTETAKDYDYVMVSDADEFLWFNETVGLKDFIQQNSQYHYMSFGKYEYDLYHMVDLDASTLAGIGQYGLAEFPFTAGVICGQKGKLGELYCPGKHGRSKLLVKPSKHTQVNVHGYIGYPRPSRGEIHFDVAYAHLKEWANIYKNHSHVVMPKEDFILRGNHKVMKQQLSVHAIGGYKKNEDGSLRVQYDSNWVDWLRFVARLGKEQQ